MSLIVFFFFFSSRRRHTRLQGDWSSDVCSSDLSLLSSALPLAGYGPAHGTFTFLPPPIQDIVTIPREGRETRLSTDSHSSAGRLSKTDASCPNPLHPVSAD